MTEPNKSRSEAMRHLSPLQKKVSDPVVQIPEQDPIDHPGLKEHHFNWRTVISWGLGTAATIGPVVGGDTVMVKEVPQTQATQSLSDLVKGALSAADDARVSDHEIDHLVNIIVIVVPEESNAIKKAETKTILKDAMTYAYNVPGKLVDKAVEKALDTWVVSPALLSMSAYLLTRGAATGNQCIILLGTIVKKIAAFFGKVPGKTVTQDQLEAEFGKEVPVAEKVLTMAGFTKHGSEWQQE